MLCHENYMQDHCSFFNGGEVLDNVLPLNVLEIFKLQAKPTLIYIDFPISERYLNNDSLIKIANAFFCSWFNSEKLKQEPFSNGSGINIKVPIKGSYIKKMAPLQKRMRLKKHKLWAGLSCKDQTVH